jgi:hypothetical protein
MYDASCACDVRQNEHLRGRDKRRSDKKAIRDVLIRFGTGLLKYHQRMMEGKVLTAENT